MRAMICWTWTGLKVKSPRAWSKQNSPWSNLPKGWGSPTLLLSTSGRKYGWLSVWRRSIGPLFQDKTVWNSSEIYPYTGRWRLQIVWRVLRTSCLWKFLTMPSEVGNSGQRWIWRNVQVRFESERWMEGDPTCDRQRICEIVLENMCELQSQSCQIQHLWLRLVEVQMATMTSYPAINSTLHTQRWGTGRSWLILSKDILGWKNHTF